VWWTNVVEEPAASLLHCSTQMVISIYQTAHHHITKAVIWVAIQFFTVL